MTLRKGQMTCEEHWCKLLEKSTPPIQAQCRKVPVNGIHQRSKSSKAASLVPTTWAQYRIRRKKYELEVNALLARKSPGKIPILIIPQRAEHRGLRLHRESSAPAPPAAAHAEGLAKDSERESSSRDLRLGTRKGIHSHFPQLQVLCCYRDVT